jgi:hypothetical protein
MDPHSIGHRDPDPHFECGSGSRRYKKSYEEKNATKTDTGYRYIGIKSIKINILLIIPQKFRIFEKFMFATVYK